MVTGERGREKKREKERESKKERERERERERRAYHRCHHRDDFLDFLLEGGVMNVVHQNVIGVSIPNFLAALILLTCLYVYVYS